MKNASLSRSALRALLLFLAFSGPVAFAQEEPSARNPHGMPVTSIVPTPVEEASVTANPLTTAIMPRSVDATQTKVLLDAVKEKNWKAARAAILAGADVNAADKGGVTVLMRAADAGQSGMVDSLLQHGANPNVVDKKGQSALHYAIPADPKPKKKFGFGKMLGGLGNALGGGALSGVLGGGGISSLGSVRSLLGGSGLENLMGGNLNSLLGGGAFNLTGKSGWTAIAGAALQGDAGGNMGISQLLGSGGQMNALSAGNWTNLLSSVKGSNPQILGAMSNIGVGANANQSALWNQFLGTASSGDQEGVSKLMQNPDLASLLQQETAGLGAAAGELPGNASRSIVSTLIKGGSKTDALDQDGNTPAILAKNRGLADFDALLTAN